MRKLLLTSLLATALALLCGGSAIAAPGDKLSELTPADSAFGVSVAFDGQFLYYNNFDEAALHRIQPNGTNNAVFPVIGPAGFNAFSFDAIRNAFWAADSSGLGIWLIPNPAPTAISGTPVTAMLQFTINPATDRPGDCENGFGCLSLVDGMAYDGATDSIWYSPDASQRIYHYSATSFGTATFATPNFIDVNKPPNDMAPECGFNYSSGVAAGVSDLWLTADGCKHYFDYSKTGTKIAAFPYDAGRAEDDECDNVTFAPLNALWVRDVDGRLAAFEQPIECKFGGGVAETKGRMTGGARLLATTPSGAEPQIAVTIHCDKTVNPNQMEVGWKDPSTGNEHRFHMTQMTSAKCSDDPTITPNPPKANFDTHEGTGTGRYDGAPGAKADWKLQDAGEPGTGNDRGRVTIKDASNKVVLEAPLGPTLDGNWQAHNTKK